MIIMRNKFDKELDLLNKELIEMGNLIESSIKVAITALDEQNIELAKRVIENDKEIDNMERTIEQRCLRLLIQHQPVAKDLRFISAALKMITDMERIGDQAADI
ncbi:MAG: phosphate transport system regulatory protein PhoU, partial [Tissierellia bacterium]|nr:phosphate transport system regulatory protein PhoU [Tissierellia bacterium]